MKRTLSFSLALALLCTLPACGRKKAFTIYENKEFHQICLSVSIEDFNALGFDFGDSLRLTFPDGTVVKDVPYYNGYYGTTGSLIAVGYPGYDAVNIARCQEGGTWSEFRCAEGDTVTVQLEKKGAFRDVQDSLSMTYSDSREDFSSDEVFANFRVCTGGRLAANRLYRGVSPIDNQYGRALYADSFLRQEGISFILDLSDTEDSVRKLLDAFPGEASYSGELLEGGNLATLGLSAAYRSEEYRASLCEGLKQMAASEGKKYVHCLEGKDRTGFVCILLEALCGADAAELEADYMITYANYYGLTKEQSPEKYNAILNLKLNDMLYWLAGVPEGTDLSGRTFEEDARNYLRPCMTEEEIDALVTSLTE